MFVLKSIITVMCIVLLFVMTGCLIGALFQKTEIFRTIVMAQVVASVCTLTFVLEILTTVPGLALFLRSVNFCFIDICLLIFFFFVIMVEENTIRSPKSLLFRRIGIALCCVDFLLFFVNLIHPFFFTIRPVYINNRFYCWDYLLVKHGIKGIPYFFHMSLDYLMGLTTVVYLVKLTKNSRSIYRGKYVVLLGVYGFAILVNVAFVIGRIKIKELMDYSVFAYGTLATFSFFVALFSGPQRILRSVFFVAAQAIGDAVICFDIDGGIIYKNTSAEKIFADPSNNTWLKKFIEKNAEKRQLYTGMEVFTVDNSFHDFKIEYNIIHDKKNRYCGAYLKLNDRTDEISKIEQANYRATHDELTGLYNRGYFFEKIEEIIKENPTEQWYLICTDIKNFKLINNLFGTENGDLLLKKQAQILLAINHKDCVTGRISGDHFAVLIKKEHFSADDAIQSVDELRKAISDKNFKLQVNVGVYEVTDPAENVHTMYDKAKLAIKRTDTDLTAVISYYDISLMDNLLQEKNILSEFQQAIKKDQFCMFLQPQVMAKDGKCVGSEALVRWYDGEGNYRSPGSFIKILEKGGYIYKLDHYVWEKAVQKLAQWKEEGIDAYISVNISARDFYYTDIFVDFKELVEKYGVSPEKLNLEITETVLFESRGKHPQVLENLRNYGFKVEMDDFGTGYSSLTKLKDLQMDVLKIDMNFLSKSENKERAMLIIHSIVKMAKALNMTVVCEGVETESQVEFLKDANVDIFQGYYFSKPIPVEEFEHKYLKERK